MLPRFTLACVLIVATCGCGASDAPPLAADGREVTVFRGDAGGSESVDGSLVGWRSGWLSIQLENGFLLHYPEKTVFAIRESR